MKHKHCELIKQWADGAKIQYRNENTGYAWFWAQTPSWDEDAEYRIKPEEPVVRWLWATPNGCVTEHMFSCEEAKPVHYTIKLEWSRTEFTE